MQRIIGIDVGYGFVKATDGKEGYLFPSVVGDGSPDHLLRTGLQPLEPTDELRLTVEGKTYYVGGLAVRHSRMAYRSLSTNREEGSDLLVLFLSALSLFCHEQLCTFSVVTGLPPGRMAQAGEFMRRVKGEHRIVRHTSAGPREVTLRIEQVTVVPQPLGTYWSQVLDDRGKVREEQAALQGRVGVIDIGFRTTDLITLESGEYVPEQSRTIPTGLATAYAEIAERLLSEFGVEREPHGLDEAVIQGYIGVSGRRVDISGPRNQAYAHLASKVLVEVRSTWQLTQYDTLFVTGGGGQALDRNLLPHFPQGVLVSDAVTANSRGYLAWANRLWNPGGTPWREHATV